MVQLPGTNVVWVLIMGWRLEQQHVSHEFCHFISNLLFNAFVFKFCFIPSDPCLLDREFKKAPIVESLLPFIVMIELDLAISAGLEFYFFGILFAMICLAFTTGFRGRGIQ